MTLYDKQGRPICTHCFGELRNDISYCRLAWTVLDEGQATQIIVSTVWMGIDMGMGTMFNGAPVIFETMAFLPPDSEQQAKGYSFGQDVYCERYPTEVAALHGHDKAVQWVRDNLFMTEQKVPDQK